MVKQSYKEDARVKDVACSLDIHAYMLSRWRKEYREGALHGDKKKRVGVSGKKKRSKNDKKVSDNAKLRQEITRLKEENDLLKKWQQYLAERHQNALHSPTDTEKQALSACVSDSRYRGVATKLGVSGMSQIETKKTSPF